MPEPLAKILPQPENFTPTISKRERPPPGFFKEGRKAHEGKIVEPPPEFIAPKTLLQAKKSLFWEGFRGAIEEELNSLEKNTTWEYVDIQTLKKDTNILRSKFVFDIKRGAGGEFLKYKARMVAQGQTQVQGIDYEETFASVMIGKSFKILLAIWNFFPELQFEHWDVKTAFVNAPLKEKIYCRQVPGFEKPGTEKKILLLKKALYGTKQAAHAWQKFLTEILVKQGGVRCRKDECVYIFRKGKGFCFLSTHVDDLFPLFNPEGKEIRDKILQALRGQMQIDDKGTLSFALDTKIERDKGGGVLKISQQTYAETILQEFFPRGSAPRETPAQLEDLSDADLPKTSEEKKEVDRLPIRNLIGKLWWLTLISRPDIQCALHKCATWQNKPSLKLWKYLLNIVKYLANTKHFGLIFIRPKNSENCLQAFCDAAFATEEGSKSRWGYYFFVLGGLVSWQTKHTTRVVSSSTEAETHALVHTGKENIWVREFLAELNLFKTIPRTILYNDNKSALTLSTGGTCHKRSKHFGIEFDIFREYVQLGEVQLEHIRTDDLPADMLTKPLPPVKFTYFRDMVMGGERLQQYFQK